MFNFTVRYPTQRIDRPVDHDWYNNCTRYAVEYGVLNIYKNNDDGEEYLGASYPAGVWMNISGHPEVNHDHGLAVAQGGGGLVRNQAQPIGMNING